MSQNFFSLTPDAVLDAVEQSGHATTGRCFALNSLENRVYDVELEDRTRVVGKFYRPGRWSRETILDEHRLLAALVAAEIPACAPLPFPDGGTLRDAAGDIHFALFPRVGGRAVEELTEGEYEQLGRLIARIHNVAAALDLGHRPEITPESYGARCLAMILDRVEMSPGIRARYADAVTRLIDVGRQLYDGVEIAPIHGDCHRGNLLRDRDRFFFLDFDDMAHGPAVQDLWLLLPARPDDCPRELDALLAGYEQFRDFPRGTLRLVELLRGLRYVRYAAWIAERWDDPAFPRAFPDFGTDHYWERQYGDILAQLDQLERAGLG